MRTFSKQTFIIATVIFGFLIVLSFFAAFAEDEGTIHKSIILTALAKLFYFLRFPTHTLMWSIFLKYNFLYIFGLVLNCMFYGFITERFITFFNDKKTKNSD